MSKHFPNLMKSMDTESWEAQETLSSLKTNKKMAMTLYIQCSENLWKGKILKASIGAKKILYAQLNKDNGLTGGKKVLKKWSKTY